MSEFRVLRSQDPVFWMDKVGVEVRPMKTSQDSQGEEFLGLSGTRGVLKLR